MDELFAQESLNKYRRSYDKALAEKMELLLVVLRQKSVNDLYMFNKNVLKVEKGDTSFVHLAPFHKELCNFVTDRHDRKKLILIPRAHLKSKLITIGYSIQQVVKNPKVRILIYSATWSMASSLNMSIQKILQGGEMLIDVFGDLSKGAPVWSQDQTRIAQNDKREPTITAAGIDNNLVG